jgi:hypothetical protein
MECIYIEDNPNFTEIENKIFVKKNFISADEYNFLLNAAKNLSEEDWNTHPTDTNEDGMISINLHATVAVSQMLIDSIIPKYWINEHKTINRINSTHTPSEFGWDSWNVADYLAVFYFGEFEGGNIKCFSAEGDSEYKTLEVETNALYLLPIMNKERYISEKVTSGTKYSFVDWVYHHAEWAIP